MKKIEAIIRKSKFDLVKEALHEKDIMFFTYWDVTGVGHEKQGHVYRGISYGANDIQRRLISFVVNDDYEEPAVQAILKMAYTGQVGDGKIFIYPIDQAYRIRTGEKGKETLK